MSQGAPSGPLAADERPRPARELAFLVAALCVAAWPAAVGFLSPSDVGTHDQGKQVMYVLDATQGHWIMPYDGACSPHRAARSAHPERGCPATKPPLYTWLAAGGAQILGLDEITVRLPSVLASVWLGLLVYALGRRLFDAQTALVAVALLATTQHVAKLAFLARTDMLLAFCVALAMHGFIAGRVTQLWIGVGLGMLAKGPAGLLIPLATIATTLLLRRDMKGARALRIPRGLAIVLGIVALWILPALLFHSQDILVVARSEGVDQLMRTGSYAGVKHQPFWYLLPYFFLKTLPWSLLVIPGALRYGRASSPAFPLVVWWLAGLALFTIPAGKRPDHLLPMYAPAALLAATVLVKWLRAVAGAAQPAGSRALDGATRLWALGAGGFALLATPLVWLGAIGGNASPPWWLGAIGLAALAPMRAALGTPAPARSLLASALVAQALCVLVYAHVLTAAAESADAPAVRRFADDVWRRTGGEVAFFTGTSSIPLQFRLRRNVPELRTDELAARAVAATPSWVVFAGSVFDALRDTPEAFGGRSPPEAVLRGAPRARRGGDDFVLARVGGAPVSEPVAPPGNALETSP